MTNNAKGSVFHQFLKFLVGLTVTGTCILVLVMILLTISRRQKWFEDRITIHTYTSKGYKLNKGDPVYFSDLAVGEISSLELVQGDPLIANRMATVKITMSILKKHARFIPETAHITVPLWNVFAHELYLTADNPDTTVRGSVTPLQDGAMVPFSEKNLTTQVRELLEKVDKEIIPGVKDFANMLKEKNAAIGEIIDDITLRITELGSTIANLNEVSEKMNHGKGTVARLINEDTTLVMMNQTLDLMHKDVQQANRMIRLITTLTQESRSLIHAVEKKYKLNKYMKKKSGNKKRK